MAKNGRESLGMAHFKPETRRNWKTKRESDCSRESMSRVLEVPFRK